MKKTIASLALFASASSAHALMIDPRLNQTGEITAQGVPMPQPTTLCLSYNEDQKGQVYLGSCDETERNHLYSLPILENGCAEGQAALITYEIEIKSCPTFVQL